jgi:hypothetical protein
MTHIGETSRKLVLSVHSYGCVISGEIGKDRRCSARENCGMNHLHIGTHNCSRRGPKHRPSTSEDGDRPEKPDGYVIGLDDALLQRGNGSLKSKT